MNESQLSDVGSDVAISGNPESDSMVLTYKFKLMPSKAQYAALDGILDSQRLLYNADLEHRRRSYQIAKERGLKVFLATL